MKNKKYVEMFIMCICHITLNESYRPFEMVAKQDVMALHVID